ncbi:PAS domain-containing sensor histidine kinase [Phenylobacterium sp.]|jgi:two-component system nitrogen regulation sensor histidine kinase NtrY|uniref:sensor histidine kinase NtrY-like n=1 Tax=Phenylobacterium sp. TaxID=1871053 RepID=UPI002F93446F
MALLAEHIWSSAGAARVWRAVNSRAVLVGGYVLAAVLTGVAILLATSPPPSGTPIGPASRVILTVLSLNLVLIVALATIVAVRFAALVSAREVDAGARLHVRFVMLFALAAVVPAVVSLVFYGVLVTRGVDNWFSERVRSAMENSATVFRTYIEEQSRYIGDHVTPMAADLNRETPALQGRSNEASRYLEALASYHAFPSAYIIDSRGRILARAEAPDAPAFQAPPPTSFKAADEGDIAVPEFRESEVMRALYRLRAYPDAYLWVSRPLQAGIMSSLREAEGAIAPYQEAERDRQLIQMIFALSYAETALLVLVGSVWLGMGAANAISAPVGRLVQAAGRVASGDLSARVDAESDPEEIAVLSRAFNSMTHDLQAQQEALRRAHEEAERRRQFIETVLAEVSAGVIGLDRNGKISAANRQAALLLDLPGDHGRGRKLAQVAPELKGITEQAGRGGEAEDEVDVVRGRESRRLRVRASRSEDGLVLTFDDITRLVTAQRNAAWRDVARRIAHEIKNPLTPIQLSAERLRKKYRKDIAETELETFDRCTETIVRQVGDIGRMVDEFSAFARMPAPKFAKNDAAELIRAAVFAQRVASPEIEVELEEPTPEATVLADGRMLGQALTNVLKNAAEAVSARHAKAPNLKGRITARLVLDDAGLAFEVEDNGIGLPEKDRDRLTEPYVTTREKGTGLGLAIVKRIMEDHGGELELADARSGQGALAVLRLPQSAVVQAQAPAEAVTA